MYESYLVINREKCLACGACVAVCGPGSLLLHTLELYYNPSICVPCGECVIICPTAALEPAIDIRKSGSVK